LNFKIRKGVHCNLSEPEGTQVKKKRKYMSKNIKCNILVMGKNYKLIIKKIG